MDDGLRFRGRLARRALSISRRLPYFGHRELRKWSNQRDVGPKNSGRMLDFAIFEFGSVGIKLAIGEFGIGECWHACISKRGV